MSSYIPAEDEAFRSWAQSFASGISNNPSLYMLTPAIAASIQGAVDDFDAALTVAITPLTRTPVTIAEKANKRSIAESLCRQYAVLIKENAGVDDPDKIAIGVRPVNPNREQIDCPQSAPLLSILGNTAGSQTLRYADTNTPNSRAKPFGASELQLFMAVTPTDDASFADARFVGKFTRNPVAVEFAEGDDGKVATYYARWASARGETGPLSIPISMRIAA